MCQTCQLPLDILYLQYMPTYSETNLKTVWLLLVGPQNSAELHNN